MLSKRQTFKNALIITNECVDLELIQPELQNLFFKESVFALRKHITLRHAKVFPHLHVLMYVCAH